MGAQGRQMIWPKSNTIKKQDIGPRQGPVGPPYSSYIPHAPSTTNYPILRWPFHPWSLLLLFLPPGMPLFRSYSLFLCVCNSSQIYNLIYKYIIGYTHAHTHTYTHAHMYVHIIPDPNVTSVKAFFTDPRQGITLSLLLLQGPLLSPQPGNDFIPPCRVHSI